ncbi:MAG: rubrerythrin family protein [Patescibacteria group bacterium]
MNKTIINLAKAFIGESQARNRYDMYGKVAVKEGLEKVADNFFLTAEQEKEHASWMFKLINQLKKDDQSLDQIILTGAEVDVNIIYGDSKTNLKSAIAGEDHEQTVMYPEFAATAEAEGYPEIANRLRAIAKAEFNHEDRFKTLLAELESDTMFKKDKEITWVCKKCGYIHTGKEAPEACPSCGHAKGFFSEKK